MRSILITTLFIFGLSSCDKEAILPAEVDFGEFILFMDGEQQASFEIEFINYTRSRTMNYSFIRNDESISLIETIYFLEPSYSDGSFNPSSKIGDLLLSGIEVGARYGNVYDGDLFGHKYEVTNSDENFFEISELDTINQVVKGSFRTKFKRVNRKGHGSERGRTVLIQGIFFDSYDIMF